MALIVAVVGLLGWAGYFNLRKRRVEMQEKRDSQVTLTKDGAQMTTPESDLHLKGKPAPDFKLKNVEGGTLSLAQLKGKPVLVNFWGTWCGPCQVEMPWFEEYLAKYKDQGLTIVGISDDENQPKEEILKVAKKAGVTYTLLYPDKEIFKKYGGVDVYPETFYISKDGTVVAETAGLHPKDEVEANIRKAIGGGL